MKIIIILGDHGSGKGEQMTLLVKNGYVEDYISTGDASHNFHDPTSRYHKYVDLLTPYDHLLTEGKYWPDDVMVKLVRGEMEAMKQAGKKVIGMEAFPRTQPQAEALLAVVKEIGDIEVQFIYLGLPDETAMARLAHRSTYDKRNTDGVNEKRIAMYHEVTDPMIAYLREQGLVRDVDDRPSIEEVHKLVVGAIKSQS